MSFEWDDHKRRLNLRKHRIEFADAASVFDDPAAITIPDDESEEEERIATLASDLFGRMVVVYT